VGIEIGGNVSFWYLFCTCKVELCHACCWLNCIYVAKLGFVPGRVCCWTWHLLHQHVLHTQGKYEVTLYSDLSILATQNIYFIVQCFYSFLLALCSSPHCFNTDLYNDFSFIETHQEGKKKRLNSKVQLRKKHSEMLQCKRLLMTEKKQIKDCQNGRSNCDLSREIITKGDMQ